MVPFAALSASYFAHIGFFNPYLPLWLQEQGLSLFTISLLASVQSATRLAAPYGWGWLSDHTGERVKLLRFAAATALLFSFGLWFNIAEPTSLAGILWIALVLFVMFMQTSAMMPMNEAAMAHLVSKGGVFDGGLYGRVRLWGSLGFLVTVFAAGAWFQAFGMAHLPEWNTAMLLAVALSAWAMADHKEAVPAHQEKLPILPILRQPAVRWFFASLFFHVLSHMSIYAFLSLYLDALGYSKTMIGTLWAIGVVVEVGWFFTQGRWLPKLSLTGWLLLCALTMAARMALTAGLGVFLPVLIFAQALHAITFAAHHSACIALLSRHFPGRLRGRGQALFTVIGYGFPGVLGGVLGGSLVAGFGLGAVFWACLAMALLASGCAWRGWRLQGSGEN
jgi:PPP family 3-phenylpropionic acid transporter